MTSSIRSALRIGALAVLLAGCAATTTSEKVKVDVEVLDTLSRYEVAYILQPGDQIEVFVNRFADISRRSVVRSDGYISLPLLGDIKASGKAPQDLARELTDLYAVRIKNPEVTVIVENPPEPSVFILGEIGGPKSIPARQVKTAAQALALAGIPTRFAVLENVSVIRLNKDGYLEAHIVKANEHSSQPEILMALQNMPLQANDLILVPESNRGQVVTALTDVNSILAPVNSVLSPYFTFRLLKAVTQRN